MWKTRTLSLGLGGSEGGGLTSSMGKISGELKSLSLFLKRLTGSFPFMPSLVGGYYLLGTRAILIRYDLLCNGTCSVTN